MVIQSLTTRFTAEELFILFQDREHCFFLDSALVHETLGRYSCIGFDPVITFLSKNGHIEIRDRNNVRSFESDPFAELQNLMNCYAMENDSGLPFIGGAVGYLGYDLCHHVEELPRTTIDDQPVPDCFFGIYDGVILIDHFQDAVYLVCAGLLTDATAWISQMEAAIQTAEQTTQSDCPPPSAKSDTTEPLVLTASDRRSDYLYAVGKIRNYIEAGDLYQVNMTRRFTARCSLSAPETYRKLRRLNAAPFAAYFDFGSGVILSSSPERFVQIRARKIQTRPIKGTRPRGSSPEEDQRNQQELLHSEKDRAELLMIVDLERNDLGRVCRPGSVRVTDLFALEPYATVHHLVATVEGELEADIGIVESLRALFPGGSITGAPKIRAMEIIDELEPVQRGIYTGSIGYIGFDGQADFNIAIRTLILQPDRAFFSAGGGIVWDSNPQMEHEEILHKASALIRTLNARLVEED